MRRESKAQKNEFNGPSSCDEVLPYHDRNISPALDVRIVDFSIIRDILVPHGIHTKDFTVSRLNDKKISPDLKPLVETLIKFTVLGKQEWLRASSYNPDNDPALDLVEVATRRTSKVIMAFEGPKGDPVAERLVGAGIVVLDPADFDEGDAIPYDFLREKVWCLPKFREGDIVRGVRIFTAASARTEFSGDVSRIIVEKAIEFSAGKPFFCRVALENAPARKLFERLGFRGTGIVFRDKASGKMYEWLMYPPLTSDGLEELANAERELRHKESYVQRRIVHPAAMLGGKGVVAVIGRQGRQDASDIASVTPGTTVLGILPHETSPRNRLKNPRLHFAPLGLPVTNFQFEPKVFSGIFLPGTIGEMSASERLLFLERCLESLKEPHGTLIERDMISAGESDDVLVTLNKGAFVRRSGGRIQSLAELFLDFATQPGVFEGFTYEVIENSGSNLKIKCPRRLAEGFYLFGHYYNDWPRELKRDPLMTAAEKRNLILRSGARVITSFTEHNPWIEENRGKDKFEIRNSSGEREAFPPTAHIVIATKIREGDGVRWEPEEIAAEAAPSWLSIESYRNTEDGSVWELARPAHQRIEYLPIARTDHGPLVAVLDARSRPLLALAAQQSLDDRFVGGYATEALGISVPNDEIEPLLRRSLAVQAESSELDLFTRERIKRELQIEIGPEAFKDLRPYFSSPGAAAEVVTTRAVFVEQDRLAELEGKEHDGGIIRTLNAHQALGAAHMGTFSDGRLERLVYDILYSTNSPLGPWLGGDIQLLSDVEGIVPHSDAIEWPNDIFEACSVSTNPYLAHRTQYFSEYDRYGNRIRKMTREYVEPKDFSHSTVSVLPLCRSGDQVFIGLEHRELPAASAITGSSTMLVVPAFRIKRGLKNLTQAMDYCRREMASPVKFNIQVERYGRLGAAYFPSAAVTPEIVQPMWAEIRADQAARATSNGNSRLRWYPIEQGLSLARQSRDGHTMTSLFRAVHAFDYSNIAILD